MVRKEAVVEEVVKTMDNIENIRNVAIVAHVDHGKTTLTDSLIAKAGLISKDLAGEQRVMDFDEQEQARGITIKSANISLHFDLEGQSYLINLIDTPGHVDFGGHVTRAMRAVDGIVLVIDAVEGIMPQTETVLKQALKERAKPTIFINKIDRLISELRLDPVSMQKKFLKIIMGVNKIIRDYAPKDKVDEWSIDVQKGNIAFGTAFHKWALSALSMKKTNIKFGEMHQLCLEEKHKELQEKCALDDVILNMIVKHLPNPKQAQPYRIPVLWKGDIDSPEGKSMKACDKNGKTVGVCFGIVHDEHAGEVAVVRLFSGTVKKGDPIYLASKYSESKIQQVAIYMGQDRIQIPYASAGNICGLVGIKDAYVGETLSSGPIEPFEQIKHYSQPVVTKSIEAKDSKDLSKLIEVLRYLSKEDQTLQVEINQETGEHLISGMGELHLEIIETKIQKEKGINIVVSPPIVVYKETIKKRSPEVEGKSPNKHNRYKIYVEPIEDELYQKLINGEVPQGKPKGKQSIEKYLEAGIPRDEAKRIWDIYNNNIFVNNTKGIQYLNEVQELLIQGFEEAMAKGPLAKEKVTGVRVRLVDAVNHEDAIHRGPAQVLPAIKRPIAAAMLLAGVVLKEPIQKVTVQVPQDFSGNVITLLNGKRGQMVDLKQEGEDSVVIEKVPVAEMFGFSNAIRGATEGKAIWSMEYEGYDFVPASAQDKIVRQIRERKGEKPEPPTPEYFMD